MDKVTVVGPQVPPSDTKVDFWGQIGRVPDLS
jgi:hypothetical protein